MIHHITYQVRDNDIASDDWAEFFKLFTIWEVPPEEEVPEGWKVRWFQDADHVQIHLVSHPRYQPTRCGAWRTERNLGHVCVKLDEHRYEACRQSRFLKRDSGSGRIWLECHSVRVEVRP